MTKNSTFNAALLCRIKKKFEEEKRKRKCKREKDDDRPVFFSLTPLDFPIFFISVSISDHTRIKEQSEDVFSILLISFTLSLN